MFGRSTTMQQFMLFVWLCICSLLVCSASDMDAFMDLSAHRELLEQSPLCMPSVIACSARYLDLQQRCNLHTPLQRPEVFERMTLVAVMGLVAVTALAVFEAVRTRRLLSTTAAQFAVREADLIKRCQGIRDQAFDLAEKLHLQSPAAGAQHNSTVHLHSPNSMQGPQQLRGSLPPSPASYQPGPASETSAPNLALLVAEASPARDTVNCNTDQRCAALSTPVSGVKAPNGNSPAGQDKPLHLQPPTPVSPGQDKPFMPKHSAGKTPGQVSSPAGRYSPKGSPASMAPASVGSRVLPGGPVAVPVSAGSPSAVAAGSPSSGYNSQQLGFVSSDQQAARPSAGHWTPPQQQQLPPQVASCPPVPGAGMQGPTPLAAGMVPHSAGQLGLGAPGSAAGPQATQEGSATKPIMAEQLGWVNTSRGSGTPMPFNAMSPVQVQQQRFAGAGMPVAGSPMASGHGTPGTGSTALSAGSLTHVHSVHSAAGSCGGSVPGLSSTPGPLTPWSAGSAVSGAVSGAGGRSAAELLQELNGLVDQIATRSAQKKMDAKAGLEAAQRKQAERLNVKPAASLGAAVRQSPV